MPNTVFSLIGPDLVAGDVTLTGGPALSAIVSNPSASNTQATLRRCYTVEVDGLTTLFVIQTGLPAQDAPGSYAVTLTPAGPLGVEAYNRTLTAAYNAATGEVAIFAAPSAGDHAQAYLTLDLAHTVTR